MQIRVTAQGVDVLDPGQLSALGLVTELSLNDTVHMLEQRGLIVVPGGNGVPSHVWLDIEELARHAQPAEDPSWRSRYERMIDYAAGEGWTDASRTVVRAHIEVKV
ncbi:hypothetical protein ACFTWF_42470 [Rhodococcus sp. NPDC056960]|uniref:hypothetical protein n=1 Tax=Rhodococcus TaxID=1827 RepID=UPI0036304213